jgi:hypothetical protein
MSLALLSLLAVVSVGPARAEVYVVLDPDGGATVARIAASGGFHEGRIWRTTGDAASPRLVLNAAGDLHGDGRPDIAVDPLTGMPRAVWALKADQGYDIATSFFDGQTWSVPTLVHAPSPVDDVDPRIAFRADGLAVVTWWTKGPTPAVRMAYLQGDGRWIEAGVISSSGERAKRPVIRQEGNLTIIAYRTPREVRIRTFRFSSAQFGDGPTPFPHDGGGDDSPPDGGIPAPTPPDLTP